MKKRLDVLLVQRGIAESREKAKEMILAGYVYVDGKCEKQKAGIFVEEDARITVSCNMPKYVGRGGDKLEKAMIWFHLNVKGKVCADIGASTGGFTDCMLQYGARRVYAIDVGHGQLAKKLLDDPRVVNLEGINARYLRQRDIGGRVSFVTVDVSFISLRLILPTLKGILKDKGQVVCLVKPQFEAGREAVGKGGIVRDARAHMEVIESLVAFTRSVGFDALHLDHSPIKGQDGNIEYLLHLRKSEQEEGILSTQIRPAEVVARAHGVLYGPFAEKEE